MLEIASQILICLVLAALLGLIIGYLLGQLSCQNAKERSYIVEKEAESCTRKKGVVTEEPERVEHGEASKTEASSPTVAPPEESPAQEESEAKMVPEAQSPQFLTAPREGKKDNLTKIKGIGTKIEEKLNELGVFHFDQIAAWTEKEIAWIDEHLAFTGRVKREDWVGQAKKLATGEETEFSKRVEAGEVPSSKKEA